jgi:hypothetical protein
MLACKNFQQAFYLGGDMGGDLGGELLSGYDIIPELKEVLENNFNLDLK